MVLLTAFVVQHCDRLRALKSYPYGLRRSLVSRNGDLLVADLGGDGRVYGMFNKLGRQVGWRVTAESWMANARIQLLFSYGGSFCDFEICKCLQRRLVMRACDWCWMSRISCLKHITMWGSVLARCFIVRDRWRANRLNCVISLEGIDVNGRRLALIHNLLL